MFEEGAGSTQYPAMFLPNLHCEKDYINGTPSIKVPNDTNASPAAIFTVPFGKLLIVL
ncbi:unnamed protein product [Meloidogyne enterolobii]|uniref:Uncharacterized protein n=1 Tax=Meloidogyne enterolobii TaxID=390850 RepID=A0ACB0ZBG2_MELEN